MAGIKGTEANNITASRTGTAKDADVINKKKWEAKQKEKGSALEKFLKILEEVFKKNNGKSRVEISDEIEKAVKDLDLLEIKDKIMDRIKTQL
ncbi:MAG: hypothetical protein ABIH00_04390 [Armatimonadota bacterium]